MRWSAFGCVGALFSAIGRIFCFILMSDPDRKARRSFHAALRFLLPSTITVNDEPDQFGNQGPVCIEQSKEEREAKVAKTYLGNVKVLWTNGTFPEKIPYEGGGQQQQPQNNKPQAVAADPDLPF